MGRSLLVVRLVLASLFVFLGGAARAQLPSYSNMVRLSGDDHRHAGSAASHLSLANNQGCSHETGLGIAVYDHYQSVGYDWVNLSYHVGSGYGPTMDPNSPTYAAWTAVGAPSYTDPIRNWTIEPSTSGFPDWTQCGTGSAANQPCPAVTPGWNESLSHAKAGTSRTVAGTFAAFAGREYTPGSSYHTLIIPPVETSTDCYPVPSLTGANQCVAFSGLYGWTKTQGGDGVLIRAHPEWEPNNQPSVHYKVWNPVTEPQGFSDASIQGIEVGTADPGYPSSWQGFRWKTSRPGFETSYQVALHRGNRLFPSYGSDFHAFGACNTNQVNALSKGAVLCWTDTSGGPWTRQNLVDAMKARRCYYSSAHEPLLQVEACSSNASGTCDGPVVPMGGQVDDPARQVRIRVYARQDLQNQQTGQEWPVRRLDRVELVGQNNAIVASSQTACTRNDVTGDVCDMTWSGTVPAGVGAVYARVCQDAGGANCILNDLPWPDPMPTFRTSVISAPVFVNWSAYRASVGQPANDSFDNDSDGHAWIADNCPTQANASQTNSDADSFGDACDNCPTTENWNQANLDGDAQGDACDPDDDGDGTPDVSDLCPTVAGPNLDSDGDGLGDLCENCPTIANADQLDSDVRVLSLFPLSYQPLPDGVGDACDNCADVYNPRIAGTLPGSRTTTGGQLDDDGDGFGNACDLDFNRDGQLSVDFTGSVAYDAGTIGYAAYLLEATVSTPSCPIADFNYEPIPGLPPVPCEQLDVDANGNEIDGTDEDQAYQAILVMNEGADVAPVLASAKCPDCGVNFAALPCVGDACDSDGDGVLAAADNCPSVANATQTDADADLVGDACDSCSAYANPRVPPGFVYANPWATTHLGQRDDDADGYGNKCDAKFPGTLGTIVGAQDLGEFRASSGKNRTLDNCGTNGQRACAIFDLDEQSLIIGAPDLNRFRDLNGLAPGPRCTACPLPLSCAGDNCPE